MGSTVTALGHLDLALLRTVRDLVPGADGPSVEALLTGGNTAQLAAKFDRLVKQHHPDEPICAQVVSWCVAVNEILRTLGAGEPTRHGQVTDQPDESLRRVSYGQRLLQCHYRSEGSRWELRGQLLSPVVRGLALLCAGDDPAGHLGLFVQVVAGTDPVVAVSDPKGHPLH